MKIIIADDHKIVREGLRTLLEKQPGMKVIAEAGDGATAVKLAKELVPNLVIMDISMPGLNGIEATRRIRETCRRVDVIILSMHADRRFVIEALKAGAIGYLLKDSAFEELSQAIRAVKDRTVYLSTRITDIVVKDYLAGAGRADATPFSLLSPREREVLQLISEGLSTKHIAAELSVSVKTVETHRQQVMAKLNLRSVAALTKYAIREGLTTL